MPAGEGSILKIEKNIFAENGGENGIRDGIKGTAASVHAQAVALCPVDFGQLRNSIMWITRDEDDGFNKAVGGQKEKVTPGGNIRKGSGTDKAPSDHKLRRPIKDKIAYIGTNSDHWYPEFGTRYMIAQPFLRPAMDLIVKNGTAVEVAIKYGREAMDKEFKERKKRFFGG